MLNPPAHYAAVVTPHDTDPLSTPARALYVGGTGNVKVVTKQGQEVTFNSVPVGILPVACTHVRSTGTTATNIVALA